MSCGCGNFPCTVSPPRKHVEVIRDPTPAPVVRREVKRNPTPPGDIIERVIVKRTPQEIIERIVHQPRKPAPRIIETIQYEPDREPIYRDSYLEVEHSPRLIPQPVPVVAPVPLPSPIPSPVSCARIPSPVSCASPVQYVQTFVPPPPRQCPSFNAILTYTPYAPVAPAPQPAPFQYPTMTCNCFQVQPTPYPFYNRYVY